MEQKRIARARQEAQIKEFKKGRQKELSLAAISHVPGIIYAKNTLQYSKQEVTIKGGTSCLHFIKKNGVIDGFIWHATTAEREKALLFGLIPVETPTAKAIAALGTYRQQTLTRAYDKGIVSNHYKQKEALVTTAQKNIMALQCLERLANTHNASSDIQTERLRIKNIISAAIDQLKKEQKTAKDLLQETLNDFDRHASKNIEQFYQQQITDLEYLSLRVDKANLAKIKSFLSATGTDSILIKVKTMSIAILVKLQELNQNLTYSRRARSFLRGDLNSACEDALKELRDYEADHHNPICAEHQGHYTNDDDTETVAIDFSHLGDNEKKIKTTLQAILAISGNSELTETKDKHYTLNDEPLMKTAFTKWTLNSSSGFALASIGAGLINIITGTIIGLIIDLPIGLTTSLLSLGKYKMPSLASTLRINLENNSPRNRVLNQLLQQFSFIPYSAGIVIGQKIGSFIGDTILDIVTGVWQSAQNIKLKGIQELIADFKTGGWSKPEDATTTRQRISAALDRLAQQEVDCEQTLTAKENTIIASSNSSQSDTVLTTKSSTKMSTVPYHLSSGEWDDITNASISGAISVNETFIHHIHAKHPFIGLLFSAGYTAGALSILMPHVMMFLSKEYLAFCEAMGSVMAEGKLSAAIASGFTQAKLIAALVEGILHGGDSWIAIGIKQFEQEPANILLYTAIAVALGYSIANYMNIPFLSEYIQEDTGDVPQIGWAFAGAKLSLLLIELLESKHPLTQENKTSLLKQLDTELIKAQSSPSSDPKIKHNIDCLHFITIIAEKQALLPELDNQTKHDVMIMARKLFKDVEGKSAILRGLKEALNPQFGKSIFTRTITLITDYIPLLLRCVLSPISRSLEPWHDLANKVIKDSTRVIHGLSKAVNTTIKTVIRVAFRGPLDILFNEMMARFEGLISKENHRISKYTYKATLSYEKIMEFMRQGLGTQVDLMRYESTSPVVETCMTKTMTHAVSQLNTPAFFKQDNQKNSLAAATVATKYTSTV